MEELSTDKEYATSIEEDEQQRIDIAIDLEREK